MFQKKERMSLYDILEVPRDAPVSEIKKAYKKLAMKHHPDKGGDPERFKKISEAYSILSDETKRRNYDQFGTVDDQEMPDINNIFNSFFGFPFGGSSMNGSPFGRKNKSSNKQLSLEVTLEDVMMGRTIPFTFTRQKFHKGKTCSTCQGQGKRMQHMNLGIGFMTQSIVSCETCEGNGTIYSESAQVEETVSVPLPKGIPSGNRLVIRQKGDEYPGKEPGDIVLVVCYKNHTFYRPVTDSLDLECTVVLTFYEFLYGFRKDLTLLDGNVITLEQSQGQSFGSVISAQRLEKVIRHKGFSYKGHQGHLILRFEFNIPKDLRNIESFIKNACPSDKQSTFLRNSTSHQYPSVPIHRL